jgi:hypothetical protein
MPCARLVAALSVEVDGRPPPAVPGLKPRSLHAFLLLHPGPHPRAQLAARFRARLLDTTARGSLRVVHLGRMFRAGTSSAVP